MYSKCDFWTSHAKKLSCTKFQLDRSFRPEVIKESVISKWRILVLIRYFAQIFKYQSFHILMIPTNGAKMKKFWEIKVSCPGWFDMELPRCFYFIMWSWCDDVISTCLISLIWVKSSRCTCLPNLAAIGLMDMDISILMSILEWLPRKKLNSLLWSTVLRDIKKQEYRFGIQRHRKRLAEKRDEEWEE